MVKGEIIKSSVSRIQCGIPDWGRILELIIELTALCMSVIQNYSLRTLNNVSHWGKRNRDVIVNCHFLLSYDSLFKLRVC